MEFLFWCFTWIDLNYLLVLQWKNVIMLGRLSFFITTKLQHKWKINKLWAEFSLFLRTSEELKFLFCAENLFSVEEYKYKAVNKTQNAFTFTALHVICEIRLWENFFLLAQTILLCWQFLDIFEKQHFLTVNLATGQPTCLYLWSEFFILVSEILPLSSEILPLSSEILPKRASPLVQIG